MHSTTRAALQLLLLCCRRVRLSSEDAAPSAKRSRHASQNDSRWRRPPSLEPCHSILSGLEGFEEEEERKQGNCSLPHKSHHQLCLQYYVVGYISPATKGSPGVITQDILALERVDGYALLHPALIKHGIPAVKQDFILTEKKEISPARQQGETVGVAEQTFKLRMGSRSRSARRTILCRSCSLEDRKALKVPCSPAA